MQRLALFVKEVDKSGLVTARAELRETLPDGLFLSVRARVSVATAQYNGGPATVLRVDANYGLYHYGNLVETVDGSCPGDQDRWVSKKVPLFVPIYLNDSRFEILLSGSGEELKDRPAFEEDMLRYFRALDRKRIRPQPSNRSIHLPKHLCLRWVPVTEKVTKEAP